MGCKCYDLEHVREETTNMFLYRITAVSDLHTFTHQLCSLRRTAARSKEGRRAGKTSGGHFRFRVVRGRATESRRTLLPLFWHPSSAPRRGRRRRTTTATTATTTTAAAAAAAAAVPPRQSLSSFFVNRQSISSCL